MSKLLNKDKITPRSRASIISLILFTWMTKLLYTGWRRPLNDDDIYQSPRSDYSSVLGQHLSHNWEKHIEACAKKKKRPSFSVAVYKTFYKHFIFYGIFSLVEECVIRLIQVIALDALIDYFNEDLAKLNSYLVAQTAVTGIIMTSVMFMLSFHWSEFGCHHTCTQIRIAVSSMIYQKTLRLSQNTLKYFSVGQLITMMSSDVHRFDQERIQVNYIWIAPLHLIAVVYLLLYYFDVGWSSIAGLGVLLVYIFCQYFINHFLSKARLNKLIASNSRMKIILEVMQVFHSIKIYALENNFYRLARESRLKELAFLRTTMIIRLLNTSISMILTKLSIFVTLLCLISGQNSHISSSKVFITILLYEHVRINFANMFVDGWRDLVEISVTLKRLTDFFLLEEVYESDEYQALPAPNAKAIEEQKASCGFNIQGLKCKWNQKQQFFTLQNINMSMKSGDFHAIIGQRESGKSSLMCAILGEIPISEGSIVVQGKIAYVPQTPWLFQGTIRDNILFGLPYEEEWYKEVLEVCTISTDIDRLREGDDAEVFLSDLSTDQKSRITIARAVYSRADIYLMDEPFASIDIKLSKQILENCIKGVLKNKAVLLVSHQIHLLEAASKVIILEDGEYKVDGLYKDLVTQGIEFVEELGAEAEDVFNDDDADQFSSLTNIYESEMIAPSEPSLKTNSKEKEIHRRSATSLVKKEMEASIYEFHRNRSSGAIAPPVNNRGIRLYWLYLKSSASKFLLVVLLILSILLQVLYSGSDYLLEAWIHFEEGEQRHGNANIPEKKKSFHLSSGFFIEIFSAMVPALIVVTIVRSLIVFKLCINASLSLFCQLTDSLLKAKPSFVEISGVGHGINKFSKDIIIVDELLPATLYELTGVFFEFIGAICILGYCDPFFLIPCFIFVLLSVLVYKIYHSSAAALKRIESNSRSPVYGHIANSLEGMSTIRAYCQEDKFMDIFDEYMDTHTNSWSLYIASYSWLSVVVDWLSILLISSICLIFIYQDSEKSSSVLVGLAISKAVELSILAQNGAVATGDMESEMISVERILEFAATPPEGSLETPKGFNVPPSWPDNGRIEFQNVSCHRHLLRNLNFVIEPGQKVGIVGRSGSGKASLFNALFRIFNVTSGKILIDGINIKDIGLHDLRKRLGALPQNPITFTGTVRSNIDPFQEFEDREIWKVLEEVGLFGTVKSMDQGLSSLMCPESGWLLSEAGTHLLSLARVLLKKQKILIWEEATSFIDPETQTFILKKLKENFSDSTVVTIAHKVHTVIDCDVIVVIEAGKVIDIGEPHILIKNEGPFFQLIDNFGAAVKDETIKMAKDAYTNRRKEERRKAGILKTNTSTAVTVHKVATALRNWTTKKRVSTGSTGSNVSKGSNSPKED